MQTTPPAGSRTLYFWAAWGLWTVSLLSPGAGGGSGAATVLAQIMAPERFQLLGPGPHVWARILFSLALFSNSILLLGTVLRSSRRISAGAMVFLVGLIAIDLAVAVAWPPIARTPAYWIWVSSLAVMTFGLIAVPDDGRRALAFMRTRKTAAQRPAAESGTVPGFLWVWLGCFAVLLGFGAVLESGAGVGAGQPRPGEEHAAQALTGFVTDEAGALSPACVERLTRALAAFEQDTSIQIAVATYRSIPAGSLEEFSIRVADASRLGRKGLDNGAILVVVPSARRARLEVGYGLEGVLNDAKAGRIMAASIGPAWTRGDADAAIEDVVAALTRDVSAAYRGGQMPSRVQVFRRQVAVEVPKLARASVPVIGALNDGQRLIVAFFAALLAAGFWDGLLQAIAIVRALWIGALNLVTGRRRATGAARLSIGSLFDSTKILVFLGCCIAAAAGVVIVAGGGAFGGAGATLHW